MEKEVAAVAARLRGVYAEKLYEWIAEEDRKGSVHGSTRKSRVFVPFHPRKRGLSGVVSSQEDVDWKALLHTVFRRFAGVLLVKGKLLNQEELLVQRFVRYGGQERLQTERTRSSVVVLLPSAMRFIVRCDDAPASRIGSIVSALVTAPHARVLMTSPGVSFRSEDAVESAWKDQHEQELHAMETVLGFEVNQFRAPASQRRRPTASEDEPRSEEEEEADDERDCANATIVRDWTFSDLRGVSRMMEANGLPTTQWTSLLTSSKVDAVVDQRDAWSYVSLGAKQKRVWSQERITRGDALRNKARMKDALMEYGSAIRLDDENLDALVKRGQVFLELRLYDDAIRDFESAQQIDPTHEDAIRGLLSAKGKLGHSKHVVKTASYRRSRSQSREATREPRDRHQRQPAELVADSLIEDDAYKLEKERLRRLLEDEERQRKLSRKRDCSADSSDTTDSDAEAKRSRRKSSKSHKKSKKSKKSKKHDRKKHGKSSRSRDDERRERRRGRPRSEASSDSSSGNEGESRHRKRKHRSRSRSRSRSHYHG